jgi:hypothetical protein
LREQLKSPVILVKEFDLEQISFQAEIRAVMEACCFGKPEARSITALISACLASN